MAEFSELIKKFDKIRDYMRDFYVYGFKSRTDFNKKSARTYDNEKRRIESYMGKYMKWDYSGGSKTSFISVDCANIPVNPLYAAWKSKSFTANDIMLHFYILDALQNGAMPVETLTDLISQNLFAFKHHYIAHTLEDGILMDLLKAIRTNRCIIFENQSERTGKTITICALPLKILISAQTGRRFACMYSFKNRRFTSFRLDYIKTIALDEEIPYAEELKEKLEHNLNKVWGVGFGGVRRSEILCMKLHINEKYENYIIDRIKREGQGGELLKIDADTFLFTKEIYDTTDMSPWIKTFTGRIIRLEGSNQMVINRFYNDMKRMAEMYGIKTEGKGEP